MIIIKLGDITKEDVDAIVNAANTGLRGGGGVDGAIHRAAGPSVMEECKKIGGCKTGNAVITKAGNLKSRHVIHAVGPVWHGGNKKEEDLLRGCYENSFLLAKKYRVKSIAFPAISTGVYGYPIREATGVALSVGRKFEKDFDKIIYVCFSERDFKIYNQIWENIEKDE